MRLSIGWDGRNVLLLALLTLFFAAVLSVAWLPYAYLMRWAWQTLALPAALFVTMASALSAVMTTAVVVPLGVRLTGVGNPTGTHHLHSRAAIRWAMSNAAVLLLRWHGLELLRCTPWMNVYLCLMGARLGDRVIVNTSQLYDLDLLDIGDDTVIGGDAVIMAHSAQDGYIRLAPVRIGRRVTIGQSAVIHGGVDIGEGAIVGALALVPFGTSIPAGERWGGVPARRLSRKTGAGDLGPGTGCDPDRDEATYGDQGPPRPIPGPRSPIPR